MIEQLRRARWLRLAPGLLLFVISIGLLRLSGVGLWASASYLLWLGASVQVPGMLLHRALLRRRPASLVTDLGTGFVIGLAIQLTGWALFVGLGIGSWLWMWPLAWLAAFGAIPALRRHYRLDRYREVVSRWVAWSACCIGVFLAVRVYLSVFLPLEVQPAMAANWYPDMYWYLGQAAELARSMPPEVAQVAGLPFHYHWFSQAHMAAMGLLSGVRLELIVARLWVLPLVYATIALSLAVSRQLTTRYWPGVLAAGLILTEAQVRFASWFGVPGYETMTFYSPSQIFGIPVMLFVVLYLVQAITGKRLGRAWFLLAIGLLLAPGTKSSLLPTIVCGLALVVVIKVVQYRRKGHTVGLRESWAALGLAVVAQLLGLTMSSAGSAGAGIQLFAILGQNRLWKTTVGQASVATYHDAIVPMPDLGLALTVLALLLASFVVASAPLFAVGRTEWRQAPAWLLAGIGFAGWCALMVLNHDGLSQAYFMRGSVVAWHVLAAWGISRRWSDCCATAGWRTTVGLVLLGLATGVTAQSLIITFQATPRTLPALAAGAIQLILGVGVVAVLVALGRKWRERGWAFAAAALMAMATYQATDADIGALHAVAKWCVAGVILGCALFGLFTVTATIRRRRALAVGVVAVAASVTVTLTVDAETTTPWVPDPQTAVTADEKQAAAWIRRHAQPFDVVATNLHCLAKADRQFCDSRSFWVTAYTQRRVLLEGWAYTESAHAAHGVGGRSSRNQPYADQKLYHLNQATFYAPSHEVMTALRSRGVRWLYADPAAGQLSRRIDGFATLRYTSGDVRVYELHD